MDTATPSATPISMRGPLSEPIDVNVISAGFDWWSFGGIILGGAGLIVAVITLLVTINIAKAANSIQREAHSTAAGWRRDDVERQLVWRDQDIQRQVSWRQDDLRMAIEREEQRKREEEENNIPRFEIDLSAPKVMKNYEHQAGIFDGKITNVGEVDCQIDKAVLYINGEIKLGWSNMFDFDKLPKMLAKTASKRLTWDGRRVNGAMDDQGLKSGTIQLICTDSLDRPYRSEPLEYQIPQGWFDEGRQKV